MSADEATIRRARYSLTFDDLFHVPPGWLSWRCRLWRSRVDAGYEDGACKYDHNVDSWGQLAAETAEHLTRWHPHVAALSAPVEAGTPAEPGWREPEGGPNDGHSWRFEVTSRGSYGVTGNPEHHDADHFDGPLRASVRAWSLSEACKVAAELALFEWIVDDTEPIEAGTPAAEPAPDDLLGRLQRSLSPLAGADDTAREAQP